MTKNEAIEELKKLKIDGWENLVTALGTAKDASLYNRPFSYTIRNDQTEQTNFWIESGLGKKIIKCIPNDCFKAGFEIEGDDDNKITDYLKQLKFTLTTTKALNWARLTGAGIVFIGLEDGMELFEPVNENRIKAVKYLRVFDWHSVEITDSDLEMDIESPNFNEPKTLTITLKNGMVINPHISRCMIFKGEAIPENVTDYKTEYFGISELNGVFEPVGYLETAIQYAVNIIKEFNIGKYKMKGLGNAVASGNESIIKERINIIDLCKSTLNSVMLDADLEDYTRESANVGGLKDLLEVLMLEVSAVSEIPITRLFGRSPAGLNSTGEGDLNNYYDKILSTQTLKIEPEVQKLINYVNISLKKPVSYPKIIFNPLVEMTEKEEAEIKKITAETDQIYLANGIVTPDEIRKSRFENGYGTETVIEGELTFEKIGIPGNEEVV